MGNGPSDQEGQGAWTRCAPRQGRLGVAKKVVIIGAGMAGLSAGCYACMNGYDVEIHEGHTQPGGLCTS